MNYRMIGRYLGILLMLEAAFLAPSAAVSAFFHETAALTALLITMGLTFLLGGLLFILCRRYIHVFYAKEGFVLVALAWLVMSLFGALPFYISREIPRFIDCFFETVSGFSTTGASVLSDVESLSRGLLFWRSFTHWLGGMGILVFLMALEPSRRGSGFALHVMRAESPGPSVGKLVPKISQTAKILYGIYIAMTAALTLLLLAGGMPLFDSLCTAFGTAGTGGFGVKNDSLASYGPYVQGVVGVFMALFGVNFALYYLLRRNWRAAVKDEEVRVYLCVLGGATLLIALSNLPLMRDFGESLGQAAFHVSSLTTTTGFTIGDFNHWTRFSQGVLMILMALGACAGSTGGGMKIARLMLITKYARAGVNKMLHPHRVEVVVFNGKPVDPTVMRGLHVYLAAYVGILVSSALIISLDGGSIVTNFTAALSCFNNIGPGLDQVGPTGNYGGFSVLSKLVLTADMLLGRLEIFPLLALVTPGLYRRRGH